jgi:hypothetical protein
MNSRNNTKKQNNSAGEFPMKNRNLNILMLLVLISFLLGACASLPG